MISFIDDHRGVFRVEPTYELLPIAAPYLFVVLLIVAPLSQKLEHTANPVRFTLADPVGHVTLGLQPIFDLIEAHGLQTERLHGDDTTTPILTKGQCTGRIWVYVRDDQPCAGPTPPAAVFYASCDRRGEHPQRHLVDVSVILQADCYNGFNPLFDRTKKQVPTPPSRNPRAR